MEYNFKFILRVVQLTSHALAIISGLCTFIPLGQLYYKFDYRCVLGARLSVTVTDNGTSTVTVHGERSQWSDQSLCHYTTFIAVVVAINAFIWGWFYTHLYGTLKESGREMALFLPLLACHVILFVCTFVSSVLISVNSPKVCNGIHITNTRRSYSCSELGEMEWTTAQGGAVSPFTRLTMAQISSWLMTLVLLAPCLVSALRIRRSATVTYEITPDENGHTSGASSGVDGPWSDKDECKLLED